MARIFHFFTASMVIVAMLLCLNVVQAQAQGAGIEWKTLNQEAMELHRTGQYSRAVTVAEAALKVAEQNVGPNHPDVATSWMVFEAHSSVKKL